jgi:flagellar hook-associated protein 3 FlgL
MHKNMRVLYDASDRLSSGKKINKPSDNAFGMTKVMNYKSGINENEQYLRNLDDAYSYLGYADTVMSSVTTNLTRARELAVQASTGTQTAETRANIAVEIANLRDEIFKMSNSKFRDRYIFSGFKTDTAAYDAGYNYQGDSGQINVMIDRNSNIAANIPGDTAFSYGGKTFMETLDDLYNALMDSDPVVAQTGAQTAITELDNALGEVSNVRADIGARLSYLDKQKTNLEDRNYSLKTFLSNTEDADIAEAVSEIAKTEMALQSLRTSGAKILSQSLLDFLR